MAIVKPRDLRGFENQQSAIRAALKDPIESDRISKMTGTGEKVAIIIDDTTRPTPTRKILQPILNELHEAGTRDRDITIVVANGLHRKSRRKEKERMIGKDILSTIEVRDHDARRTQAMVELGATSRGTPVWINKNVVEADLRVLTGHIGPHSMAGYTGGGKAILPGTSGIGTITADHGFQATADPKSVLGQIRGNPIREDIEEAAKMVGPCFIANVVMNSKDEIVEVVAGDMIKAHRVGTRVVDRMAKVALPRKADVVIAACNYPKDISLYQATCGIAAAFRLPVPIVREDGVIILLAECREGVGSVFFHRIMKMGSTPEDILERISQPNSWMQDQWAAQIWCTILKRTEIVVVTDGITKKTLTEMNISHATSVDEAIGIALKKVGKNAEIAVLPEAPCVIATLQNSSSRPQDLGDTQGALDSPPTAIDKYV
jgi:nickel-dependent lactate racemase